MGEPGLLASGRDADVYVVDRERVLRRYRDRRDVTAEAEVMRHARGHGYPVPELYGTGPGEMVLQYLRGPTMSQALVDGTVSAADAGAELARLLTWLHTVPARGAGPGDRLLHLDLHPENIVLTEAGPVVIDWCNAADGPPGFDVAMTALILAQVAVGDDPRAAGAHAVLGALLRHAAVDPGHLAAVVARRGADRYQTAEEIALLPVAAGLVRDLAGRP